MSAYKLQIDLSARLVYHDLTTVTIIANYLYATNYSKIIPLPLKKSVIDKRAVRNKKREHLIFLTSSLQISYFRIQED